MLAPSFAATVLARAPGGGNLDGIVARILVQPVEFEIAVIVGDGLRDRHAVLEQTDGRALDAVNHAVCFRRDRSRR